MDETIRCDRCGRQATDYVVDLDFDRVVYLCEDCFYYLVRQIVDRW